MSRLQRLAMCALLTAHFSYLTHGKGDNMPSKKKASKGSNRGRKNKYHSHVQPYLEDITQMCRDGLMEVEISKRLGVAVSSFNVYKNQFPELSDALKSGKQHADFRVEDALFKRATGYEYEEESWITVEKSEGEQYRDMQQYLSEYPEASDEEIELFEAQNKTKMILEKRMKKKQAPDTTAAIFWLKNRKPHEWRDKREVDHSGEITNKNVDLSKLDIKDLESLAKLNE